MQIIEEILSGIVPLWNRLNLSGLPHPFLTSPKKRRHLSETAASVISPQQKRKRNSCEGVLLASQFTDLDDYEMDDINEDTVLFDATKISPRRDDEENTKPREEEDGGDKENGVTDEESSYPTALNKNSEVWPYFKSANFKQLQDSARNEELNILDENGVYYFFQILCCNHDNNIRECVLKVTHMFLKQEHTPEIK